jgi:formylglycine-generating enzyme required for sulfatase activity
LGESASLWVLNPSLPGGELEVALLELASRGRVVRQDLAASSIGSDNDIDADGVPDFRDNCIQFGVGASQTDSNGNGIGDACEGIDNPGLTYAPVADVSNAADPATGKGSVGYEYEITTTEVTNADYVEFLNAVAADDPNGLYNELMGVDPRGGIVRDGVAGTYSYRVRPRMAIQPANFVSWLDAARYANWEENGRPIGAQGPSTTETGAFDLTVPDPSMTAVADASSRMSLPTEDEHYKAAYFDPSLGAGGGYWAYPTQSDSPPTPAIATPDGRVGNTGADVANFDEEADWNGQDGNVTAVGTSGAMSFYGGADFGGNVEEWLSNDAESGVGGMQRVVRGGGYTSTSDQLASTAGSSLRNEVLRDPLLERSDGGFRIVRIVPEPGATSLLFWGVMAIAARERSRRRDLSLRSGCRGRTWGVGW